MNKPKDVKPMMPLKHDFVASLDRFINEAGLLADAVESALQLGAVNDRARKLVEDRIKAFQRARWGEEE